MSNLLNMNVYNIAQCFEPYQALKAVHFVRVEAIYNVGGGKGDSRRLEPGVTIFLDSSSIQAQQYQGDIVVICFRAVVPSVNEKKHTVVVRPLLLLCPSVAACSVGCPFLTKRNNLRFHFFWFCFESVIRCLSLYAPFWFCHLHTL